MIIKKGEYDEFNDIIRSMVRLTNLGEIVVDFIQCSCFINTLTFPELKHTMMLRS